MSYVLKPSSGSGGVQNPMTANLDAGGFDIEAVDTLTGTTVRVDSVIGLNGVSGDMFTATTEISHVNPAGTIGFFGVPPAPQPVVAFPIVGADPVVNEDTINQICFALQQLGLIA